MSWPIQKAAKTASAFASLVTLAFSKFSCPRQSHTSALADGRAVDHAGLGGRQRCGQFPAVHGRSIPDRGSPVRSNAHATSRHTLKHHGFLFYRLRVYSGGAGIGAFSAMMALACVVRSSLSLGVKRLSPLTQCLSMTLRSVMSICSPPSVTVMPRVVMSLRAIEIAHWQSLMDLFPTLSFPL